MRDENGLRRHWILLNALTSRRLGLSIRQMAEEAGVTQRTIRRDLDLFRSVGFPLEESTGELGQKIWKIKPSGNQPPLGFSYDEAIALHMGTRMLEPLAGTPFGEAAENALRKIRGTLGLKALEYLKQFAAIFHETGIGHSNYASKSDVIDMIRTAAEERNEAMLLYRAETDLNATYRHVHPYGMVSHHKSIYLVALDVARKQIKHYKLDRIDDVEILDRSFDRPDNFQLAAHMAPSFGVYRNGEPVTVEVRFMPEVARYLRETRWHESQELTTLEDGATLLKLTVSGTEEIKRWVLGFGVKAEVLQPESLRREVIDELRSTLAKYASSR